MPAALSTHERQMKAMKPRAELLISGLVSSVPMALITSNGTTNPIPETGHRHMEHGIESSNAPTTANATMMTARMCRRVAPLTPHSVTVLPPGHRHHQNTRSCEAMNGSPLLVGLFGVGAGSALVLLRHRFADGYLRARLFLADVLGGPVRLMFRPAPESGWEKFLRRWPYIIAWSIGPLWILMGLGALAELLFGG